MGAQALVTRATSPRSKLSEVIPMGAQELVTAGVAPPVVCKLRVRYGECDPQGVVFNANYLAYFDIGITEMFRSAFGTLGGYQALVERSGLEFVVAEAGLRYHRPARFDEDLSLEIALTRLGTTSITTSYRLLRDEDLLVEGTVRHVLVDPCAGGGASRSWRGRRLTKRGPGTKTAIPDWMREGLAPYLEQ